MRPDSSARLRRIVADRLESLHQAGVLQLPKAVAVIAEVEALAVAGADAGAAQTEIAAPASVAAAVEPPSQVSTVQTATVEMPEASMPKIRTSQSAAPAALFEPAEDAGPSVSNAPTLEVLREEVAGCTRCSELASTRTQTVFGVGDPKARLCILGEAPGADEDKTGIPFVGRGGQLLTKIIEACRMTRDDVYILNMLKCRPPNNRNPLPNELANCRGYLERQLDLIKPEFICCFGAVAAQNLLGTTTPIGKLRGKVHAFRGIKVVCTYHPAFLLRSPSFKKETWEDMKFLMREMGVEL